MRKKCISILTLILLVAMPGMAQNFKIQYGPYLQNVGENEATVVFVTDEDAMAWVELAPDDGSSFYAEARPQFFDAVNGRKRVGRVHKITITGLKEGTGYRYRAFAREVINNEKWDTKFGAIASTNVYSAKPPLFKTRTDQGDKVNFAVFNDIHENSDKLEALTKTLDLKNTDLMIFNGDMVSNMHYEEQVFAGFVNKSVDLFAKEIPFYMTRGNHETRGAFSTEYMNYFPTSTGKPYYYFRQGPVFFLMLDSGEDKPDTDIEYGGLGAYDPYRAEEAEWLKKVVEMDEFKQAPIRIVMIHIPGFNLNWHGDYQVSQHFYPILNNANIDLMFCGHTHRYNYLQKGEKGMNFPIITNSANEVVDVKVNGTKINVQIKDQTGKVTHTFDF